MGLENVPLIDESIFDNWKIKRSFSEIYHQQGANPDSPDKIIDLIFADNSNFYQIGNAYLQFLSLKKNGGPFEGDKTDTIRLVNSAFAHLLKQANLLTTGESEKDQNKHVGPVFNILRVLTIKYGVFSPYFDANEKDNKKTHR